MLKIVNTFSSLADFKEFGRVFHNLGPTYESIFKPRFVLWYGIRNLLSDLRVVWLCSTGKNISDMYKGAVSAINLKMPTHKHCSNLSLVGNQFVASNSLDPIPQI